jgi:hypothetical protein
VDGNSYGDAFGGLAKLAIVGIVALILVIPAGVVLVLAGLWWAWSHVSIH